MTEYRFSPQSRNCTIQVKSEPKDNEKEGQWRDDKFYGNWTDAIRHCLLNREIYLIGDDLAEQLANFPNAIDRAAQQIENNLDISPLQDRIDELENEVIRLKKEAKKRT